MTKTEEKAQKFKDILEDALVAGGPWTVNEEGILRPDIVVEL